LSDHLLQSFVEYHNNVQHFIVSQRIHTGIIEWYKFYIIKEWNSRENVMYVKYILIACFQAFSINTFYVTVIYPYLWQHPNNGKRQIIYFHYPYVCVVRQNCAFEWIQIKYCICFLISRVDFLSFYFSWFPKKNGSKVSCSFIQSQLDMKLITWNVLLHHH
jgi:hypothetical protein